MTIVYSKVAVELGGTRHSKTSMMHIQLTHGRLNKWPTFTIRQLICISLKNPRLIPVHLPEHFWNKRGTLPWRLHERDAGVCHHE